MCYVYMATKEKQATKSVNSDKLKEMYIDAVLTGDQNLTSVYAFCKSLKIKEDSFYKHFNSFKALEDSIWSDWLQNTLEGVKNDASYLEFSVREKLLSFYFTWFEVLLKNRSFVNASLMKCTTPESFIKNDTLKVLKTGFTDFANELVREGEESGEIPYRQSLISKSYQEGLWLQFIFLMNFWKNDTSKDFADTDAAIEKSVNLSLDLIGRGPLDAMVDFAKFMYQQARN